MNQNLEIRVGTRESELAVWQATYVQQLLKERGYYSSLVYIKSEGDTDQKTPLYEMGVQGIFTKALDVALLNNRIDIAVHSMKDVPTAIPNGLIQAAVLKRANQRDILVPHQRLSSAASDTHDEFTLADLNAEEPAVFSQATIATSSLRRKAQWLNRFPHHKFENLRGNVNTRLEKLQSSDWHGAIFAAAGLERIGLRPSNAIEIDWMLPAPAQGAIMLTCRFNDQEVIDAAAKLNDERSETCTKIERDFLRALSGGCSTPIGALAQYDRKEMFFMGNIVSVDGKEKVEIEKYAAPSEFHDLGTRMAYQLLENGGREIAAKFR